MSPGSPLPGPVLPQEVVLCHISRGLASRRTTTIFTHYNYSLWAEQLCGIFYKARKQHAEEKVVTRVTGFQGPGVGKEAKPLELEARPLGDADTLWLFEFSQQFYVITPFSHMKTKDPQTLRSLSKVPRRALGPAPQATERGGETPLPPAHSCGLRESRFPLGWAS
jgi:hypothetical protein